MNLLQRAIGGAPASRALPTDGVFGFQGSLYPTLAVGNMLGSNYEPVSGDFVGLVQDAYKANGVVFACMLARMMLFSEARFQYRRFNGGRPGDLYGNQGLALLEKPWPNGTTGDLLTRMISDADLAGNAFVAARPSRDNPQRLRRLRPDWVTIVLGSMDDPQADARDIDAEVLGYIYHPGGVQAQQEPVPLLTDEVAHFAPLPDPLAVYRGMSWLTPVLREIDTDGAAQVHKAQFFRNGATPQTIVSFPPEITPLQVEQFAEKMNATHAGVANAYKTLYLGGGAAATVTGSNLAQLDFKVTQGAGETRIAAASGIHPAVLGLSEGLQGASLNAGNFSAARRLTADKCLRPLWRNVSASLAHLVDVPGASELWYDDRDIPFLREDSKDLADIQLVKAQTIQALIIAGYTPDSIVTAVENEDFALLVHTGYASVQLQQIGTASDRPALQQGGTAA